MVRGIDLSRSAPPAEVPPKVSVGGLMVAELTQWLAQQAPAEGVENVAVHVGVNDCLAPLSPIVTSQQRKTLLLSCQHVFTSAKIKASGIVRARCRHTASTAIRHSNTNLHAVCQDMGVMFVNHTPNFTALSGAPKMALYKDAIHPNKKGTVCLALNLFPPKNTHNQHASPPAISSLADFPPLTPHRVRNFPPLTPHRVRSRCSLPRLVFQPPVSHRHSALPRSYNRTSVIRSLALLPLP